MKKIVVVGIGNKLMMDDGIGIYIVDKLNSKNKNSFVHYVLGETDVEYCLSEMNKADYAIIIDAAFLELPPCTVVRFPLNEVLENIPIPLAVHDLDLFHALKRERYSGEGILVGIQPHQIGFSLGLSQSLAEGFNDILNHVDGIIEDVCKEKTENKDQYR